MPNVNNHKMQMELLSIMSVFYRINNELIYIGYDKNALKKTWKCTSSTLGRPFSINDQILSSLVY